MSIKIFSRGKGASAVQKAAYRAAVMMKSEYDGETHDYTKKTGIVYRAIMLPENAPVEYNDRSVLWNAVEKSERFVNAQLAREIEISLPIELTKEQNVMLARKFAKEIFVADGMCVDICVHDNGTGNPHAHIMLTMRPFEEDGSWGAKSYSVNGRKVSTVDWNEREKAEYWRKAWAKYQNAALEKHGYHTRVDHRSYFRQGKEKIPTVHMGASSWMEKRGIRTEQGDRNRKIDSLNKELRQTRARLKKLKTWLYSQPLENAPSMGDVLRNISSANKLKSRAQKIKDLQTYIHVTEFLRENNLDSIESLSDKVISMHQEQYDLASAIKKQDRRLNTLDEHLRQTAIYNQTKAVYKRYTHQDPKKREGFRKQHVIEISKYEAAHKYLKEHLNGRTIIPEKAWESEREKLLRERIKLAEQYYDIKADVKNIEVIRGGAENVVNDISPENIPTRVRNYEL